MAAVTGGTKVESTIERLILAGHQFILNSSILLFRSIEALNMAPAAKATSSRVFIALEIGDQVEAARQEQGYKLAQEFLKSAGSQVGHGMRSSL